MIEKNEKIEKIEITCKLLNINNFIINEDLSVDVMESVNISHKGFKIIPIKFNNVYGDFDCSANELKSMLGCPAYVSGNFYAANNCLSSLRHIPKKVGGGIWLQNNYIENLYTDTNIQCSEFYCFVPLAKYKFILGELYPSQLASFIRYMGYYDVYDKNTQQLNEKEAKVLVEDILDGLI